MAFDVSNTPDGYTIDNSGSFTFNTKCGVRTSPDMSVTPVTYYQVGQSVYYTHKVKNGNHFWLSYIGASGNLAYVPYANTDTGTMFGTDTNDINPIKPADGGNTGGSTGGNTGSDKGTLGSLTGQDGANVADQTPDNTRLAMSGTFTFTESAAGRNETLMAGTKSGDKFYAGDSVVYVAKVKADGHYWLEYQHFGSGTYYVPYATINPFRYYGTDSNQGDPVYSQGSTGGNTGGETGNTGADGNKSDRPQGGQDTPQASFKSTAIPNKELIDEVIHVRGFVKLEDSNGWTREAPDMNSKKIKLLKNW
ncbi:SH3 domain-containing protein [Lentilactobacillus kosonis]|uniref:Muramidase n=1 Tax=Lentilactobacillus kosonis TaxID=2810561 RepID=A0A401FPX7_9LACO|nr:SH3 domain-containing protein [Lentilactobacillus kosonis]GAY74366.1 muramidase [Lentilactobacillus kosonis]